MNVVVDDLDDVKVNALHSLFMPSDKMSIIEAKWSDEETILTLRQFTTELYLGWIMYV